MKKLVLIITASLFTLLTLAQQNTVWITVEDNAALRNLKAQSIITSVKQALPDSKLPELQKVVEVETTDLIAFLQFEKSNKSIHTPEIIQDFQPLYTPNDYSIAFPNDYALDLINAEAAWDLTHGDPIIQLGVLDTGYDTIHEELTGKFNHLSQMNLGASIIHGTAVAITVAGNTDNNLGKSAIGFDCSLSLRSMSYNEMLAATYAGTRVLNISWASGCMYNSYYQSVIDEVYNNGTVIIAAAGNGPTCGGPDQLVYPAAFDNVIAVSSIDENDNHQPDPNNPNSTHQHNDKVDLVAPGYDVALSVNNNQYLTGNGTSFAAPYVTGTVGLMLSVNPCLTPAEIELILKQTAVDIYANNQNFIGQLGAGRLNAGQAVQMAKDMHPIQTTVVKNTSACQNTPGVFVTLDSGNVSTHTIQWSDGSHDWNRYNLSSGNYSYMITNTDGCMLFDTLSFTTTGPEFDYLSSQFISNDNQTIEDINNDGVVRIKGTVIIESGVDYTLNDMSIEFADNSDLNNNNHFPNSGIVVMPGAKLTSVNTEMNNVSNCSSQWGGIEVRSDEFNQYGTLDIFNTTISNAVVGVSTVAKGQIGQDVENGGHLYVTESAFINNQTSIHFEENNRNAFVPQIVNCDFVNQNIANAVHIYSNQVDINVRNCYFEGAGSLLPTKKGVGLKLINSKLKNINVKPITPQERNVFDELQIAIQIQNFAGEENKIDNMLFTNNTIAINIENSQFVVIDQNEINIPEGTYSYPVQGVNQTGDSKSIICSNKFIGSGNGVFSTGVLFNQQNNETNTIRNNEFKGEMGNAISFEGDNKLEYLACNDFDVQGLSDVVVKENNGHLGTLEIQNDLLLNNFSTCSSIVNNLDMTESAFFSYEDATDYSPKCTAGNVQVTVLNISVNRENKCEFEYKSSINNEEAEFNNTLGIDNNEASENKIYPNPNNGSFSLDVTEGVDQINIYSSTGSLVRTIEQQDIQVQQELEVAAGLYTVIYLSEQNEVSASKMIVQ